MSSPISQVPIYSAEGNAITGTGGRRFHNRPLYGDRRPVAVLAGDRLLLRYLHEPFACGSFLMGWRDERQALWFHDFENCIFRYFAGRMEWTLSDSRFAGREMTVEVLMLQGENGFVVRTSVTGGKPGDEWVWAYGGGPAFRDNTNLFWHADPCHQFQGDSGHDNHQGGGGLPSPEGGFDPVECEKSRLLKVAEGFHYIPGAAQEENECVLVGRVPNAGSIRIGDARQWKDPLALLESTGEALPLAVGTIPVGEAKAPISLVFRSFLRVGGTSSPSVFPWENNLDLPPHVAQNVHELVLAPTVAAYTPSLPGGVDVESAWKEALKRVEALGSRLQVKTPDLLLNAAIPAAVAAMDACYYPPLVVHGAMSWNVAFPGWCVFYGMTALSWHREIERVAKAFIASQITESSKTGFAFVPEGNRQSDESRFYGRGRIILGQYFYNFQEQFFEQMIHAWRWTGSRALEEILRPALELHLEWLKECFDADGDGVYESYINYWASDSVWYGGGGCAVSSAYAYSGHQALSEMWSRAGNQDKASQHQAKAAVIRDGVWKSLWVEEKGILAEYREALAHRRRHESISFYSVFIPITCGMTRPEEAVQMLSYTEWALERTGAKIEGEFCAMSNWMPAIWSVRAFSLGDNFHLALAYYQMGLGAEGWKLLAGCFKDSMFNGVVPGGLASEPFGKMYSSTDFADAVSLFHRVVVEGLFGFCPNRAEGRITWTPQFPEEWKEASFKHPEFEFEFKESGATHLYRMELPEAIPLTIRLPIRSWQVEALTVNGKSVSPVWECGYEHPILIVEVGRTASARVEFRTSGAMKSTQPIRVKSECGAPVEIVVPGEGICEWCDPQGTLTEVKLSEGRLIGKASQNKGDHLALARVQRGAVSYWKRIYFSLKKAEVPALSISEKPFSEAVYVSVDLTSSWNADVRTVYQQRYLEPRPKTVSLQLGYDGYSTWTYTCWGKKPPLISLEVAWAKQDEQHRIRSAKGVPFIIGGADRNIAFTSIWDNWPTSVRVPVDQVGEAVWVMVIGTSNPMQTGIANAILRFEYESGGVEALELWHPENYWDLAEFYDYEKHGFALPKQAPEMFELGKHCRAMIYSQKIPKGKTLKSVALEALSPEIVVGLAAITIQK